MTFRVALALSYQGSSFEGWQTQPHGNTVQDRLQEAVASIAGHPVQVFCAGRTDTGVHARQQVVHFDTPSQRPESAWIKGVNAWLPPSVSVQGACRVPETFHARFGALSRAYRYFFYTATSPCPLKPGMVWLHYPVNLEHMRQAALCLLGTHDFSAFRSSQCQANSPVRTLYALNIVQKGDWAYAHIQGNAFLHHMVRNIMGCLLEVGLGNRPVDWVCEVLKSESREQAARTYPAHGLTLWEVEYPQEFGIAALFSRAKLDFL
ncbi:MAG: tRNA pseudouridine(38-40) synthase TruA [Limnobacter sp.]|nr:tRNA pseudouridine(38-40) synthase TruA [Limnobacter sp.]